MSESVNKHVEALADDPENLAEAKIVIQSSNLPEQVQTVLINSLELKVFLDEQDDEKKRFFQSRLGDIVKSALNEEERSELQEVLKALNSV